MSPIESGIRLPYPGLRSFQRDESDLFFGREGSVNDMINRLRPNHFLAVLGTSGSGKSSLVRIGLLDGLELGLLAEAGPSWRIVDFAPGADPLRNLARELARLSGGTSDIDVEMLKAFLARGPRSVIEWCQDGHLKRGQNLLILVDQFEELFRYQDYAERQAAEAFVALLIESARSREVPIYVVITMRSEYLGACALIEGLAEIINDGQYLTPRLKRDECREAIVGPAAVSGTIVEDDLVNRLLNDLEDFAPWDDRDSSDQLDRLVRRADQLPLLQHTLNRLWLRADAVRTDKSQPIILKLSDYDAIGGLRGAINAHAEEILAGLGPERLHRAEQVFRALTDGKTIATAVRRPTRFADLVQVADGDEPGTRAVVDAFRETGVNFLRPDTSVPLDEGTIVDISHESLIRQWRRLSGWLQEEARVAQEWTRLGEAAARFRRGEGARYHGQDLHFWREHERPTAAWARRYNQPYDETLGFLDGSFGADKRQRQMWWAAIAAALVVVVGFGGGGLFFTQLANKNGELLALNDQLAEQSAVTQQALDDAVVAQQQAEEAKATAEMASIELDRLIAEASSVFRASFDSGVGEYQAAGNWPAAGALLGSLLEQTGTGRGADRVYDSEMIAAIRYRLAEQSAFPAWLAFTGGQALRMAPTGMQREGVYAMAQSEQNTSGVRLIDRLTGRLVAETTLPDDLTPDTSSLHLVTEDAANAVIVASSGQVFLWRVADNALESLGTLSERGSAVQAISFDQERSSVAVLLGEEDSLVQILPGPSRLLSLVAWEESAASTDERVVSKVPNGKAIGPWGRGYIVSFDDGEDANALRTFAYLDAGLSSGTLIDPDLIEALPARDGTLFGIVARSCTPDGAIKLVQADGRVEAASDPYCLGTFSGPNAAFAPLMGVRPYDDEPDVSGTTIANVAAGEAAGTYQLTFDDAEAGVASRLTAALAVDDGVAHVVPPSSDDAVPLALTFFGENRAFIAAPRVSSVVPLVALPDAAVPIVFETDTGLAPLAEIVRVAPDGAAETPSLGVRPVGTWPADSLGPFDGFRVAANDAAMIAILGSKGGVRDAAGVITPGPLEFGAACGIGGDNEVDIVRLVPWSRTQAVFLGVDGTGRVMRIVPRAGGGGSGSGPGGGQSAASAATLGVECIGQVRAAGEAIVLADPDNDRVILQTTPQELRILPSLVQTRDHFGTALRLNFDAPLVASKLLPGPPNRFVSLDRAGNLIFTSDDPTWPPIMARRSVVIPDPVAIDATADRALVVGSGGEAVLVDITTRDVRPVAAGRVPQRGVRYAIEPDGTVSALVAGAEWRMTLPPLGRLDELARVAEASAGSVVDPSDQALVSLGVRLINKGQTADGDDMALSQDARCFLAADGLLAAWQAEAGGESMLSPRLSAAQGNAIQQCKGPSPTAAFGVRLAETQHYASGAADPWPEEWSALVANALAGNTFAQRALVVGLSNSSDPFAKAAGGALMRSPAATGVVFTEDQLVSAAAGAAIDPAVEAAVRMRADRYEPEVQELLGTIAARSGDDEATLREAWVRFRVAEVLYRASGGRSADADRVAATRVGLVRALPSAALLESWDEAAGWSGNPEMDAAMVTYLAPEGTAVDRMRADAASLAASPLNQDGRFDLLEAYLWLRIAESEATAKSPEAGASYSRFVAALNAAADTPFITAEAAADLAAASRRLTGLAQQGAFGEGAQAAALAPFMLGVVETDTIIALDAGVLRSYAETLDGIREAIAAGPVSPEILAALKFNTRQFDHGFQLGDNDSELYAAGQAALTARTALLDTLLAISPRRSDVLAAKGTTEFWTGLALYPYGAPERASHFASAIRYLTEARAIAGPAFPTESLYWLAEARRWLPLGDDAGAYVNYVLGGVDDFAVLLPRMEDGSWNPPLTMAEFLASYAEFLGLLTEGEARLLEARNTDAPGPDASQARLALDTLFHLSLWDDYRRQAIAAGSEWSSLSAGLTSAPGRVVGVLGGQIALNREGAPVPDACDVLASAAVDPLRRAPAVPLADLNGVDAVDVCDPLWDADQSSARLSYLVGRSHAVAGERSFAVDRLRAAADAGYAAAFSELSRLAVGTPSLSGNSAIYEIDAGYNQRAMQVAGPVAEALRRRALFPSHLAGLAWFAEQAGNLGDLDSMLLAAELSSDPADKAYRQAVAARIADEAGDNARAKEIRGSIDRAYLVDASDRAEEWLPEKPVPLPTAFIDQIRQATN